MTAREREKPEAKEAQQERQKQKKTVITVQNKNKTQPFPSFAKAMEEQQQQHLRTTTHRSILDSIARLSDPQHREERHKLFVSGRQIYTGRLIPIDRHSLKHLVNFLDTGAHAYSVITDLDLYDIRFYEPPDGGVNVLSDFFARSDTTLTRVMFWKCDFGSQHATSQLLAAFHTNRIVTDLTIQEIRNLQGAALGNSLCGLLQNMPQLQRLNCTYSSEDSEDVSAIRAMQPGLRNNQTLNELQISECNMKDAGIHLLADTLVGNTTMQVLEISYNGITSNGLDDITRLLESTRLQTIDLAGNYGLFGNKDSTKHFARVLSRHEYLTNLNLCNCRLEDDGIRLIADTLVGSTVMKVLDISANDISSNGLDDIIRLIESTRLQTIDLQDNPDVFDDEDATQHFVMILQHKKSSVQELPGIDEDYFPNSITAANYATIDNSLTRNQQLNRVNLLLAPPPSPPQHPPQPGSTMMMLKISHKAITKFAKVPNNAGASAIFKLFQARPALLEKRLKRPPAAAAAVAVSLDCSTNNSTSSVSDGQQPAKRQRLQYSNQTSG